MRKTSIPAIVMLAWSISLPAIAAGPLPPAKSPDDSMVGAITSIAQAPDPSAAISAFSAIPEPARGSPRVLSAYVQRMVGFGVPEIAFHQAESLVAADPNNGVGWAVVGFVNAKKGSMSEALAAISKAAACQPDEPFVQAAAGQLAAWFDANPIAMTEPIRQSLDALRKALGTRAGFVTAYNQAKGELTPQPQAATPASAQSQVPQNGQPGQPDYNALMAAQSYQAPSAGYLVPDYGLPPGGYYAYPDYSSYGVYGWWSPSPFFAGTLCSPSAVFVSPFFFGGFGRHHHEHHFTSGFDGKAGAFTPSVASGGSAGKGWHGKTTFNPAITTHAGTFAPSVIHSGSTGQTWHGGSSVGVIHASPSFSSSGSFRASTPSFSTPHFSASSSSGGGGAWHGGGGGGFRSSGGRGHR